MKVSDAKAIILFVTAATLFPTAALALPCYNLAHGEPRTLTGILDYVVFPGPPNYDSVRNGDAPEATYVLRLAAPICLMGDPEDADPTFKFKAVQLVGDGKTLPLLGANVHRHVTVSLKDPMAAENGHHHEPLVVWVTAIRQ